MRIFIFLAAALAVTTVLNAQTDQPLTLTCQNEQVVKAEVRTVVPGDTVVMTVTPVNQMGEHIPGLTPADFTVKKGKKTARIIDVSEIKAVESTIMRVVFMVDNSQSMSPHLSVLKKTLGKVIRGFSASVRVSVIFFKEGSGASTPFDYNGKPLSLVRLPYTYDKDRAANYTKNMLTERNLTRKTYLYEGVYATAMQIEADTGTVDMSYAIIFSDGEDLGSTVNASAAELSAGEGNTTYFTIDYLTKSNDFLVSVAEKSGGEHFQARNAEDLEAIFDAIANKLVSKGYQVSLVFKKPPTVSLAASTRELVMEEEIVRETFPLLNYVFFEQGSAAVPDRYVKLSGEHMGAFDETAIEGGALDFYYNMLNVIGSRLKNSPSSKITISGYLNNFGNEKRNKTLASDRATAVRDYLQTLWGISPERMTLESGSLPPVPSSSRDSMGRAENRRVEIQSDNWEIMKPVTFVRRFTTINPPTVVFTPAPVVPEGLANWVLYLEQNGQVFDMRKGSILEKSITWNWKNTKGESPASTGVLTYTMLVTDRAGDGFTSTADSILVRKVERERRQNVAVSEDGITREKISLVLFPFNSAEPGERNDIIMQKYVYPRVTTGASVAVTGYTDIIGKESYNQTLSQKRAKAVFDVLGEHFGADLPDERKSHTGVGASQPVFSNSMPEGRFYNRTVSLLIER